MLYDEVLLRLGDYGRYQKLKTFLVCLVALTSSFHSMNMVFIGGTPQHHCKVITVHQTANLSKPQLLGKWTIPRDHDGKQEKCKMIRADNPESYGGNQSDLHKYNITSSNCKHGWTYSRDVYRSTIVSEWDLVCDDRWKRSLASTIFFAGRLVGALVAGQLSDKFGRRPTFFVAVLAQVLVGLGASMSPDLYLFYALYFLQGVVQVAVYLSCFIIGNELVAPSKRAILCALDKIAYAIGQIILCLIAFGIRDWRYIELTISLVSLIYISYYWLLPESTRWLLTQGRHTEGKAEMRKIARMNKVEISEDVLENVDVVDRRGHTFTAVDLLRGWEMAKISLNVWFNWMVCALVYYGLNINTRNLAGDPYVNFLIAALVELPACLYVFFLLDKFGRCKSFFFFSLVGGISCGITGFLGNKLAITILAMVGKLAVTASYGIIYLIAAEVFPTVARNVGVGFASVCARVGGMMAPQILLLGDHFLPLPLIIFGALSITGGFLGLLLPEPTGRALPQTFEDIYKKKGEPVIELEQSSMLPVSSDISSTSKDKNNIV